MLPQLLLGLLLSASAVAGFNEDFQKLRSKGDHAAMSELLAAAAESEADNPDYYALASNYWWSFAAAVSVTAEPAPGGGISLRDPESGAEVGSIRTNGDLDPSLRKKSIDLTAEGFRRFPQRLDLGFGHAQVLFQSGDAKSSVATLLKILKTSTAPKAELKWSDNAGLPQPAATFVPEAIQGYTAALFQQENDEADALCKQLLDATVAAFPDHPFAYNLLAALADAQGDQQAAYRHLKTAASKAPNDTLILCNLADAHRARGHFLDAAKVYQKIIDLEPDGEAAAAATEGLEAVKKEMDQ
jgi:tetratricopeptide (TPR) repeat protein